MLERIDLPTTIPQVMTTRDANVADIFSALATSPGNLLSLIKTGSSGVEALSNGFSAKPTHKKIAVIKDSYQRIATYQNVSAQAQKLANIGKNTSSLFEKKELPKNLQETLEKAAFIAVEIFGNLALSAKGICNLVKFWNLLDVSYVIPLIGPSAKIAQVALNGKKVYQFFKESEAIRILDLPLEKQIQTGTSLTLKVGTFALTVFALFSQTPWIVTASFTITTLNQVNRLYQQVHKASTKKIEIEDTSHLIDMCISSVV